MLAQRLLSRQFSHIVTARPPPLPIQTSLLHRLHSSMAPTPRLTDRRPIVLFGPSGSGKGTLWTALDRAHPDTFALSVSHTTRQPRAGEEHGKHYFFVTPAEFEALVAADGFVEHARFGSNRYGTSKAAIEAQGREGKVTVLDIEIEGVKQIKALGMDYRFVFISPLDTEKASVEDCLKELEKRLRGRGTEDEGSLEKRLKQARVEFAYAKSDPCPYDVAIVNNDKEEAYKDLDYYVIHGERRVREEKAQ